ncbi:MAG: RES family NAD+ phosphorylase [Gammaproteobacteria bacterium]|nr:RES family NAD+ phosphorylase [Gammaproteobacteria bacterium]
MSSTIWTQCAASSDIRPFAARPWRSVEAQHQSSTRKLVDTVEEQEILEEILEQHKPPLPAGAARLHYLLATPFRYPPLRHGSRFGSKHERGIWYGAEEIHAMFAEVAYYRLLFIYGSEADLGMVEVQLTLFRASMSTEFGLDLTDKRFRKCRDVLGSKDSYAATQQLGKDMREAGVKAFRYFSARTLKPESCIGVLDPTAFNRKKPTSFSTWYCFADKSRVEFKRTGTTANDAIYTFPVTDFLVEGKLPEPAP